MPYRSSDTSKPIDELCLSLTTLCFASIALFACIDQCLPDLKSKAVPDLLVCIWFLSSEPDSVIWPIMELVDPQGSRDVVHYRASMWGKRRRRCKPRGRRSNPWGSTYLPWPAPPETLLPLPRLPGPDPCHSPGYREPRWPPPNHYLGEPTSCHAFLVHCTLIFELQPSTFSMDQAKVVYVITLLGGKARLCGSSFWESGHPATTVFTSFAEKMRRVFDQSSVGQPVSRKLLHLWQG